jgi:hypothetical protein
LDAKTDTSVSTAGLEILRKELKDLEEKVRVTKELICDKEASIACSQKEAEYLKAKLSFSEACSNGSLNSVILQSMAAHRLFILKSMSEHRLCLKFFYFRFFISRSIS